LSAPVCWQAVSVWKTVTGEGASLLSTMSKSDGPTLRRQSIARFARDESLG
jgi:hypothetical protein